MTLLQQPFSVGLTLESLHAQSTDETWNPAFLKTNENIIHKVRHHKFEYIQKNLTLAFQLVSLRNFAVYWNSRDSFVGADDTLTLKRTLDDLVSIELISFLPVLPIHIALILWDRPSRMGTLPRSITIF